MIGHVRVLAWLHIVFGALGLVLAVFLLVLFGGIAAVVGTTDPSADARVAAPLMGGLGGILFVVVAALSAPGIIAGIGLLKFAPWGRILGIVMSALNLLSVPFGTALGIYGLWVLTKRETEALFSRPAA